MPCEKTLGLQGSSETPNSPPPLQLRLLCVLQPLPLVNPTILSAFHTHSPLQLRLLCVLKPLPLGGGQGSQRSTVGAGGRRRRPPRAPPLRSWVGG